MLLLVSGTLGHSLLAGWAHHFGLVPPRGGGRHGALEAVLLGLFRNATFRGCEGAAERTVELRGLPIQLAQFDDLWHHPMLL